MQRREIKCYTRRVGDVGQTGSLGWGGQAACVGGLVGGLLVRRAEEGLDILPQNAMHPADAMRLQLAGLDEALHGADRDLHQRGGVGRGVDRSDWGDDGSGFKVHNSSRIGAGSSGLVQRQKTL